MMDMKEEINNLIKVSLVTYICLGYCYYIGKIIPKGFPRLLTILPISFLFLSLPLYLNSVHFIGVFSLFVSWLANFKLLLFAFGIGPLSTPSIPLSRFLALAFFPIKNPQKPDSGKPSHKSVFNYGVKGILFAVLFRIYFSYMDYMSPKTAWCVFGLCIYLFLELILATSSMTAGFLLGLRLEPTFDEPYISTSLQNFWGRRWNIMVNRTLHPVIYQPVYKLSSRLVDRMWAHIPAIVATFVVSGLMHEIIFFYFTRAWPKWDVMFFFSLHGVCLVAEITVKKAVKVNWNLPRTVAAPLVVAFVMATSYRWFRPALLRCNMAERALEDYSAVRVLANDVVQTPHVYFVGRA